MTSFAAFGIREELLQGLDELGIVAPTPVQEQVIPFLLKEQRDCIALAQTGTGKTAAFGVPLLQLIEPRGATQALVLCPTRELCMQVARDLTGFSRYLPGVRVVAVYGGARIDYQIEALRKGVQILVATPGRLNDLIGRRKVDISAIRFVVLDEADEMLQMGFQEELTAILAETPAEKTTLLFSATMGREVAAIANTYMREPREITVGQRNAGTENVRHLYYLVHARDKYQALRRIADSTPEIYAIIFCRTRQDTKEIADQLMADGYNADALHGDLSQSQRDAVMQKFRRRTLQLLVATDVAARGLDVQDLSHVINYNLPDDIANYTHRSGRTGRAGKTGISIAIVHLRERHRIAEIEQKLQRCFEQGRLPSGQEICEIKLRSRIEALLAVEVDEAVLTPLLPAIEEQLAGIGREELIRRVAALELARVGEAYRNAPDLNVREEKGAKAPWAAKAGAKSATRYPLTRFVLNVGRKEGVRPEQLIGQINGANVGARIRIGRIEIKEAVSFIEADSRFAPQVLAAFEHLRIKGKPVTLALADAQAPRSVKPFGGKTFAGKAARPSFPSGAGRPRSGSRKKGGK
ncbi:MAG: DEAD/DEAH box helicase [Thermodesulfobacteriota bacterium]